jgi:spore coat polysaccharide biosynthesis predicted glycosyltransferase SpsG
VKTVYLRADGGTKTGWGHINRLAGLASMLRASFNTVFVTAAAETHLLSKLRGHADRVVQLPELAEPDFASDFQGLETQGHILVADGYHFPVDYFPAARAAGMRTVFIDDFARGPFHCDCVINHAPACASAYVNLPDSIRLCDGIAYALLRPAFYTAISGSPDPRRILLSMGAADPESWTLKLLKELVPAFPSLEWQVMLTGSFEAQHRAALAQFADAHKQVVLHPDLDAEAVCGLMESCGHALVSASTTLFEAWSRGIFAAAMAYTDNQRLIYEGMVKQGMAFPFLVAEARASLGAYLRFEGSRCRRSAGWNPPAALRKVFEELAA